ncbi:hypothetical protein [Clostridium lacusfryxellense]|uniref:hypothetical protein n=1 Tax=Clostridium lacusfryxellense TaxID=205328 RepID=UPI001C0CBA0E|nr:hypothetical protein [Clostridium lacusfryxellense]MBU3113158.1 hypothetical protein [Clostridium lacusfryxellense]
MYKVKLNSKKDELLEQQRTSLLYRITGLLMLLSVVPFLYKFNNNTIQEYTAIRKDKTAK